MECALLSGQRTVDFLIADEQHLESPDAIAIEEHLYSLQKGEPLPHRRPLEVGFISTTAENGYGTRSINQARPTKFGLFHARKTSPGPLSPRTHMARRLLWWEGPSRPQCMKGQGPSRHPKEENIDARNRGQRGQPRHYRHVGRSQAHLAFCSPDTGSRSSVPSGIMWRCS